MTTSGDDSREPGDSEASSSEPQRDSTSDPAHDERLGHDWSAEGGATSEGPATAVPQERDSDEEE